MKEYQKSVVDIVDKVEAYISAADFAKIAGRPVAADPDVQGGLNNPYGSSEFAIPPMQGLVVKDYDWGGNTILTALNGMSANSGPLTPMVNTKPDVTAIVSVQRACWLYTELQIQDYTKLGKSIWRVTKRHMGQWDDMEAELVWFDWYKPQLLNTVMSSTDDRFVKCLQLEGTGHPAPFQMMGKQWKIIGIRENEIKREAVIELQEIV